MLIYVCNPKEETRNPAQTKFACYLIAKHGHVPIAPRLYFPQFIHHGEEPLIEQLLSLCDEMWVIGSTTDSMQDEMEMALREHIPIQHFINMEVMANQLEDGAVPSAPSSDSDQTDDIPKMDSSVQSARTFNVLMGELLKVNNTEETERINNYANARARTLEPKTHIRRETLEKIIYLFSTMTNDMEKVKMSDEEKELLINEGLTTIADKLGVDRRIAALVLLMADEKEDDDTIVEVITEYCAEHVPDIVKATGVPHAMVDKIVFISNIWRWRDREEIKAGSFKTWWPKHIKNLANLLGQSEGLIRKILAAELASQ